MSRTPVQHAPDGAQALRLTHTTRRLKEVENKMRLLKEIKDDVSFIQSHSLQPKWYKVLKVFILVGFLAGYFYLFGLVKTLIFFSVFLFLMLLVHFVYRIKTDKFRKSWLDFVVVDTGAGPKAKSIGKFYYSAIILSGLFSVIMSQVFQG